MTLALAADATLYATARARYYEAVDGRSESLGEARELFRKLRESDGSNPKVLAYTGSIELMEASRAIAPWKKGRLAKEGLQLLDDAVARAPQDLEVRFVRAASTFRLPEMFRRREQSEKDFAWLASRVSAAAASGVLDARVAAAALHHHRLITERARRAGE
jgi:hypothetical protein